MICSLGDYLSKNNSSTNQNELNVYKSDHFHELYSIVKPKAKECCDNISKKMIKTEMKGLITQKYTEVLQEKEYKYNAPHAFKVVRNEDKNELASIHFQEGPIKECGVNGVAGEDLIAMVLTRLESFQESEFACKENEMAINKLTEALLWLRKRTLAREIRGVEGTHIK